MHSSLQPIIRRLLALGALPVMGSLMVKAADTTKWSTDGYTIYVQKNSDAKQPFFAKGICYAVAPIGDGGAADPPNQDYFYYRNDPSLIGTKNWSPIWKRDIAQGGQLRSLGANTIRIYSFLKYPYTNPNSRDESAGVDQNGQYFPAWQKLDWSTNAPPDAKWQIHDGHDKFLDMCWNNGVNPIYVWIGVPFDNSLFGFRQTAQERKDQNDKYNFFLKTCEWLAKKYGNHPAVIGFILGNEHDQDGGLNVDAIKRDNGGQMPIEPMSGWDPKYLLTWDNKPVQSLGNNKYQGMPAGTTWRTEYSDKLNAMYDVIKANAPDKLVTTALHDNPRIYTRWIAKADDDAQTFEVIDKPVMGYLKQDVFSVNIYRDPTTALKDYGPTIEAWAKANNLSDKIRPVLFTEVGVPASTRDGDKAVEMPDKAKAQGDYQKMSWDHMIENRVGGGGAVPYCSGGYVFGYVDEWFKSGEPKVHNATPNSYNPAFPGKYGDEEWFGIYSAAPNPLRKPGKGQDTNTPLADRPVVDIYTGDLNGGPDVLTPRAAVDVVKAEFAKSTTPQNSGPMNTAPAPQNGRTQGTGDFLNN